MYQNCNRRVNKKFICFIAEENVKVNEVLPNDTIDDQ